MEYSPQVTRYGMQEIRLTGESGGNPYIEREVFGEFTGAHESKRVRGFYDGEGVYKVRFMPAFEGEYSFRITGNYVDGAEEHTGRFDVVPPRSGEHGPVHAVGTRLYYADGTAHVDIGTTCYVWTWQTDAMVERTLESLRRGPFNKIRFCIFPKHYDYNYRDPVSFPYEGTPCDNSGIDKFTFSDYNPDTPGNSWDFSRFNPAHFRRFEVCVERLRDMGIQADVILMHPYDRWGFSRMPAWADDLYLRYAVARLAAYSNVWWSLANEFDFMRYKTAADWERFGRLVTAEDPYRHMLGVHNCFTMFDHSRPWVTHCSVQRIEGFHELTSIPDYLEIYKKPVVIDEMCYEGNVRYGWGNISGRELTRRSWTALTKGAWPGHSETYIQPGENLWWSHGGELRGEIVARLGFMRKFIEQHVPGCALKSCGLYAIPADGRVDDGSWRLYYFGAARPSDQVYRFKPGEAYRATLIDTWGMTYKDLGTLQGNCELALPGDEDMALLLERL